MTASFFFALKQEKIRFENQSKLKNKTGRKFIMPSIISINREEILELTRRMTLSRTSMTRIAGSYMDSEGFIDGTFNTNFLKLQPKEKEKNLAIAKIIPFSPTNKNLKRYILPENACRPGGIRQLLLGIKSSALKNDALLEAFYEYVAEKYHTDHEYAIYLFHNTYDIPLKASDKENLWESEEMYEYLICAICPVSGDYEPGEPECGFLFPAIQDRTEDPDYIDVYQSNPDLPKNDLLKILQLCD